MLINLALIFIKLFIINDNNNYYFNFNYTVLLILFHIKFFNNVYT